MAPAPGMPVPSGGSEVSREVLEEGCYFLSQLGLSVEEIASHFEITASEVTELVSSFTSKLKSGQVTVEDFDRTFWSDVMKEAEGDVKLTVVSDKGIHHTWKSDLQRLDGASLMTLYEASRDFLESDPNQRFLDYPPPKGYDPLAMDREVRRAVELIKETLETKWKDTKAGKI